MEITNQSENRDTKADPKHAPKAPVDKAQPQSIWSDRLRWNIAFHVVGSILALLAIVIMVNYLAARHFDRFYLGKGVQARMSQRTLNILHSLALLLELGLLITETRKHVRRSLFCLQLHLPNLSR